MASFYDSAANFYDVLIWGTEKRYKNFKRHAFSTAKGKTLLVGVGTGVDIPVLPPQLDLIAIDLSSGMLAKAEKRAKKYSGDIQLQVANIEKTNFPDHYFDTVITSCVFCSVKNPVEGLKEIRRILKPEGSLLMFEHVLSKNPILSPMLYMMNLLIPRGPNFTRNTVNNVKSAGFKIVHERNIYMDIVKQIEAVQLKF